MKGDSYTAQFKAEAVKQVIERGHGVVEVSNRLGVSDKSLYLWARKAREQRSGYYAWKAKPKSVRAQTDEVLTTAIPQSFEDSHGICGSPRIHRDLREIGVLRGKKGVARLMRAARLRSVRGYKKPRYRAGKPAVAAPNRL